MGLDVSVYKNIELCDEDDDYDFMVYLPYEAWDYKIKNLIRDAYYNGDRIADVGVSYGYGTHSRFRESLIMMMGREDLLDSNKEIDYSKLTSDLPFYDFIDFSDCEGCLDWEISEKIYNDFQKFYDKAMKFYSPNPFYMITQKSYIKWHKIFDEARKNKGVVVFR